MRILAIETASPPGSVALLNGGEVLAVSRFDKPRNTTQQFAPLIRDQLQQVNWMPRNIQLVAVTNGPGSFTGLRIGVTAAKVFAYAVQVQVVGINTLEAIAAQCPATDRDIEAVVDAQRGQVFAARFRSFAGRMECLKPTSILDAEQWIATRASDATLIGTGLHRLRDRLSANMDVTDEEHWAPRADSLGRLAMAAVEQDKLTQPMDLKPQYYRKSAAEEKISGP